MKQAVINIKGEKVEELELAKKIFDVARNDDLLQQVTVIQMGNQRQVSAKVKDRSEVSGGGKKPWRQKGTGRARHGSIRSPIWSGGGVTHGPTAERNYKRKLNVKMRRKALFTVLSEKLRQKQVIVLDSLNIEKAKTKDLVAILNGLPFEKKSTLLVLPTMDEKIIRAAQNIPYVQTVQARELSALLLTQITYIVLPKESLKVIEETFLS
ncbi:MAG: 50S ribosomal protein L4 [bacterium]|nr:50S ribosomal protein L4 [bacterium]